MSDKFYLIVGIILSILGAGAIGAAISNRKACTEPVVATVSSLKAKRHNIRFKLLVTYTPTFSYTVGGKKYSKAADFSSLSSTKYAKGKELPILVNPKDPNEIRVGNNLTLILFGIICAAAGVTMIVCYFL